jgi:hypothetical protein
MSQEGCRLCRPWHQGDYWYTTDQPPLAWAGWMPSTRCRDGMRTSAQPGHELGPRAATGRPTIGPLLALGALAGLGYGVVEIAGVVLGGVSNPIPFDDQPTSGSRCRPSRTTSPNVLAKLHVVDRSQAALRGREAGLG